MQFLHYETLYSNKVRLINPPSSGIGLTSPLQQGRTERQQGKGRHQTRSSRFGFQGLWWHHLISQSERRWLCSPCCVTGGTCHMWALLVSLYSVSTAWLCPADVSHFWQLQYPGVSIPAQAFPSQLWEKPAQELCRKTIPATYCQACDFLNLVISLTIDSCRLQAWKSRLGVPPSDASPRYSLFPGPHVQWPLCIFDNLGGHFL